MKVLIIYFTMGGRTKKIAEAIASTLINHEVSYFSLEITGKFSEKLKVLEKFRNNDFSLIEPQLNTLNPANYEMIIFGMPTHGGFPPVVFNEIIKRIGPLNGKKGIVFTTARMTGRKALNYMEAEVEKAGAQILDKSNFRVFFSLGIKKAIKFGAQFNI